MATPKIPISTDGPCCSDLCNTFGVCIRVVATEEKGVGVGWFQSVHSDDRSTSH